MNRGPIPQKGGGGLQHETADSFPGLPGVSPSRRKANGWP